MDEKKIRNYFFVGNLVLLFMGLFAILVVTNAVIVVMSGESKDVLVLLMLICSVIATAFNIINIIIQREFNIEILKAMKKHAKMTLCICLAYVIISIIMMFAFVH